MMWFSVVDTHVIVCVPRLSATLTLALPCYTLAPHPTGIDLVEEVDWHAC